MANINYGKRGQKFEQLLNMTNATYTRQERALIQKRPTPMKIVGKTRNFKQHICIFDDKSTVDYDGVYQGRSIQFEAKSVGEKRFDLKNIHSHQVDFLTQAESQGAICFILVNIRPVRTVFLIPVQMLNGYIKRSETGGRKSIPLDELEVYSEVVESANGVALDYLSVVDKLIAKGVA